MCPILYFVIPCYNEEEVLPETSRRLLKKLNDLIGLGKIKEDSRILFIDDGSKDKTWGIICDLHNQDKHYSGLKQTRNRGHQNALIAGLYFSSTYADITISMDADLQDDVEVVDEMIKSYTEGHDIVYGVRNKRKTDSFFKRTTAEGYYKFMRHMGVDMVYNHADFRLMSSRAVEGLKEFKEVNLFLRGIVPLIGYPSDIVYYERAPRFAGESKYPIKKMLSFAWQGITSFSIKPIQTIISTGLFFGILGFVALISTAVLFGLGIVESWSMILSGLFFVCGLNLTAIGIVGEYVGKNYLETKHRPTFLIEEILNEGIKREIKENKKDEKYCA